MLRVLLCLLLAAPPVLQSVMSLPVQLVQEQTTGLQPLCCQVDADSISSADAMVLLLLQSVQEQVMQEEAFARLAASMRAELADEPEAGDRIPAQSHNPAFHLVKTDPSECPQALNVLAQSQLNAGSSTIDKCHINIRGGNRMQLMPIRISACKVMASLLEPACLKA